MARYIIRVEAEDGATECYGTWRDGAKAGALAEKLRDHSGAYTGDEALPHFRVSVETIQRWPGIRAASGEVG